jgi:hypothetical protein
MNRGDRAARRRQRRYEPSGRSPIVRTARDLTDRPGDARGLRRAGPQLETDARAGHPPRHLRLIRRAVGLEPDTAVGEAPDTTDHERDTAAEHDIDLDRSGGAA